MSDIAQFPRLSLHVSQPVWDDQQWVPVRCAEVPEKARSKARGLAGRHLRTVQRGGRGMEVAESAGFRPGSTSAWAAPAFGKSRANACSTNGAGSGSSDRIGAPGHPGRSDQLHLRTGSWPPA
jgi:hypothetical protein